MNINSGKSASVIVQARTGSTRLPGKVVRKIKGRPLLWHLVNRLKKTTNLEKIIVATTDRQQDDIIETYCKEWDIQCFRGSENDVLDRYYNAGKKFSVNVVMRITGDCPLIDERLVDEMIDYFHKNDFDYLSNTIEPTYPDGMDIEIFTFSALEKAWQSATLLSDREHVTPFIYKNSNCAGQNLFKTSNYSYPVDFSHIRLTVDEENDFEVVKYLIENLEDSDTWMDYVSELTKNPEMILKNIKYKRNEGYAKSLTHDSKKINIPKSLAMQFKAKKIIPGMTQLLSKRPDQFSAGVWPGYFSKARGAEVWDLDGNHYIDMCINSVGANILGYADNEVDHAVSLAIRNGTNCSLNCPEEVELAEILCNIHPWAENVKYARTGGEAMAIAVRIARASTGKDKVAFCGYHGWHDWYLSANLDNNDNLKGLLLPGLKPDGVPKCLIGSALPFHYNRIDELEDIILRNKDDLASIIIEPIRNDFPENGFLESVRNLSKKHGIILIVDEISSGFRMNCGGAHLLFDFEPDIAVFSKALGNGYPIAAVIGKEKYMTAVQNTFISSTYWTERIGPSAAIAMIKKYRTCDVHKHLCNLGNLVQSGWKDMAEKHNIQISVGGIFPISHFSFNCGNALKVKAFFVQKMLERGFLASTNYYAMYAHNETHVEQYILAVDEVFFEISELSKSNDIDNKLNGKPSVEGFKRLN